MRSQQLCLLQQPMHCICVICSGLCCVQDALHIKEFVADTLLLHCACLATVSKLVLSDQQRHLAQPTPSTFYLFFLPYLSAAWTARTGPIKPRKLVCS